MLASRVTANSPTRTPTSISIWVMSARSSVPPAFARKHRVGDEHAADAASPFDDHSRKERQNAKSAGMEHRRDQKDDSLRNDLQPRSPSLEAKSSIAMTAYGLQIIEEATRLGTGR